MSLDIEAQKCILGAADIDLVYRIANNLSLYSEQTGQLLLRWSFLYLTIYEKPDEKIAEIAHLALGKASMAELRDHIIAYNMVQMLPSCKAPTAKKDLATLPVFHFIYEKAIGTCRQQIEEEGREIPKGEAYKHFVEVYMGSFAPRERYYLTLGQIVYQSLIAIKAEAPPTDLNEKRLLDNIEEAMVHPGETYLQSVRCKLTEELKEALKAL